MGTEARRGARVFIDPGAWRYKKFKYSTLTFARHHLDPAVMEVVDMMAEGFERPTVTYWCQPLEAGESFGHRNWHGDGEGTAWETHRLLTFGGTPTEGDGGAVLDEGYVWEYSGTYLHRARPAAAACERMLIRVSDCLMKPRNHIEWSM